MSKDDIDKAAWRPEQYAAQDKKMKEDVEVRNQADQMVYQSEKTLSEMGDKIPADDKNKVQAGIDKLKEALKGTDTAAIKAATDALTQDFYAVSEKLYQQANPRAPRAALRPVPTWAASRAAMPRAVSITTLTTRSWMTTTRTRSKTYVLEPMGRGVFPAPLGLFWRQCRKSGLRSLKRRNSAKRRFPAPDS